MLPDLPPTFNYQRTRDQHIADHGRIHRRLQQYVFSEDYPTLQAALDDVAQFRRPLVIAQKTYTLAAPLLLDNQRNVHIFAYGATVNPGANMPALLEMRDCTDCTVHGGRWNTGPNFQVDNAIYVYHETFQSSRCQFYDVTVEGHYGAGVRIGKMGQGGQCDHHTFTNLTTFGTMEAGQVGVYVGGGTYGNLLNHTFNDLKCSGNEKHVVVDATNVYIVGAFFDRSVVDLQVNSPAFSIQNVRSEEATRFLVTGGPSGAPANISVRDVIWHGEQLAADGEWLQMKWAGSLLLEQVRVVNAPVAPKVRGNPGAPLVIHARGLTVGGGVPAPYSGAFAVSGNVTVKTDSYIELAADGRVLSIAP